MQNHRVKSFDDELDSVKKKLAAMAKRCEEQLNRAAKALAQMDTELAETVIKEDEHINWFNAEIQEEIVVFIAKRQPMAVDLRQVLSAMKISSELERIGDYASSIAKRVQDLTVAPEDEPQQMIIEMAHIGAGMIQEAISSFLLLDQDKAAAVWHRDDEVDIIFVRFLALIREQMNDKQISVENGTQLLFMARCCERIGDHITNIAEDVYYIQTGRNYIGGAAPSTKFISG